MSVAKRVRKAGGLLVLICFVALIGLSQGAYPPSADISVAKSGLPEVNPNEEFSYTTTVKNWADVEVPDVVVTDKLPYEAVYISHSVSPDTEYDFRQVGDMLVFTFSSIPGQGTVTITVNVTSPNEAPTTLYNTVNVRYEGDTKLENNTDTNTTYVLLAPYEKFAAVKSFEDLLHNQSQLLFSFEDLLHVVPRTPEEDYKFITSFEQLLRSQADLTRSFEDLMSNSTSTGWDEYFSDVQRVDLLNSYETMLRDEAFLFASFEMKLKTSWENLGTYSADGHTHDAQTEFIASFEDLLKKQVTLYKSFELLFKKIEKGANPTAITQRTKIAFLASFEDLLRIETNLLMSFEDLLKMKYKGGPACEDILSIEMESEGTGIEGTAFNYTINITNLAIYAVTLDTLTADYEFINDTLIKQTACLYTEYSAGWKSKPEDNLCSGAAEYDTSLIGPIDPGATATVKLTVHVSSNGGDPTGTVYNTVCATWDNCKVCNSIEIQKISPYPVPPQVA